MEQRGNMKKQRVTGRKRWSFVKSICHIMALVMLLSIIPPIAAEQAEAAPVTESSDFLIYVEDIYTVTGRGTVVSGRVVSGTVNTGDTVILAGSNADGTPKNTAVKVEAIEMFHKLLNQAREGDNIGIQLGDYPKDSIKIGDALISDSGSPYRNVKDGFLLIEESHIHYQPAYLTKAVIKTSYGLTLSGSFTQDYGNIINFDNLWITNMDRAHVYYPGEMFTIIDGSKNAVCDIKVIRIATNPVEAAYAVTEYGSYSYYPGALDYTDLDLTEVSMNSVYPWKFVTNAYKGDYAVSTNNGAANSLSEMSVKVNLPKTCCMKFSYKARGEGTSTAYDTCIFLLDGQTEFAYGNLGDEWKNYSTWLSSGEHTLTWRYKKDNSVDPEGDYFAITGLVFYPPQEFTIDANGGTFDGVKQKKISILYQKESLSIQWGIPVRPGYIFRGYYTIDPETSKKTMIEKLKWSGEEQPMTVYADWEKIEYNLLEKYSFEDGEKEWTEKGRDIFRLWGGSDGEKCYYLESYEEFIDRMDEDDPYYQFVNPDQWIISPGIRLESLKYTLKFDAIIYPDDIVAVYIGTIPDVTKMRRVGAFTEDTKGKLKEFSLDLNTKGIENRVFYIAFHHTNTQETRNVYNVSYDTMDVRLDNVRIYSEYADVRTGSDNGKDPYYYDSVYWATSKGITGGVKDSDGVVRNFNPQGTCTRAQMVSFLWRMAGCPEPKKLTNFKDVSTKAYYYKAVCWAQEKGITGGYSDGTFGPDNPCTRGQAVTFLYRMAGQPKVISKSNFKDVKKGTYYYNAVLWAEQTGITGGYSDNTFRPDNKCTRAQMVTFLFRYDFAPKG